MALIVISARPNAEPFSAQRGDIYSFGLKAGEALTAGWAVRVHSDGTIMGAITTTAQTQSLPNNDASKTTDVVNSDFLGFVVQDYALGDAVTVFGSGCKLNLADATMTPGTRIFVSATKGRVEDVAVNAGDTPVALAISASQAVINRG